MSAGTVELLEQIRRTVRARLRSGRLSPVSRSRFRRLERELTRTIVRARRRRLQGVAR